MKGVIPAPRVAYAHNLLDNSDFRNPINQRGQSSYTTPWGYTLDRWYTCDRRGSGEEEQTLTIISGGIRLTGAHVGIAQRVPLLDDAKAYTLAYMDSSGKHYCNTFRGSEVNFSQYGFAQITIAPGNGTEVVWAALYEGAYSAETLPPYHPKGYAEELAECRRYFCALTPYGARYACNVEASQGKAWALIPLQQPMRAQPSLTDISLGVIVSGGAYVQPTGILDYAITSNGITITLQCPHTQSGEGVLCDFGCSLNADL